MAISKLRLTGDISDPEFDIIYPPTIRLLSARHWTSVLVAQIASNFLCYKKGIKVLDIGSGVGKFCLIGATLHPDCCFCGIELRNGFSELSQKIKDDYNLENITFIKGDIIQANFQQYDGAYFFNSFHEQIDNTACLGENNYLLQGQYASYVQHLFEALKRMPLGARIATYHTSEFFIPECFEIIEYHFGGNLKLYKKTKEYAGDFLNEKTIANHILIHRSWSLQ